MKWPCFNYIGSIFYSSLYLYTSNSLFPLLWRTHTVVISNLCYFLLFLLLFLFLITNLLSCRKKNVTMHDSYLSSIWIHTGVLFLFIILSLKSQSPIPLLQKFPCLLPIWAISDPKKTILLITDTFMYFLNA